MMLYEQVQAYDELDMSVMRLRERLPDEPVAEAPQVYIIERAEVNLGCLESLVFRQLKGLMQS